MTQLNKNFYSGRWRQSGQRSKNPFFPKRRRVNVSSKKNGWGFIILIIFFLVLICWVYLFLISSYFRIARVDIKGDNEQTKKTIGEIISLIQTGRRWLFWPQNNIYIFPKKEAEKRLAEQLLLEEILIDKQYPNVLRINFITKKPALSLITNDWNYTLDIAGDVIEKRARESERASSTPKLEFEDLPILEGSGDELFISAHAISADLVRFIRTIFTEVPPKTGFTVKIFSPHSESPSSLNVKTDEGWQMILNIRGDAFEQVEKLQAVLKQQTKEEREKLNYIDLRFGDRVFYK